LYALNLTVVKLIKARDQLLPVTPLALLGFLLSLVTVKQEAAFNEVLLSWPFVTFSASLPVYVLCILTIVKKLLPGQRQTRR
jgi:hypothetical protein